MATKKHLNLALQGGGSHGAFTWGVLHEILNDERLEIEGISGTSAGAINAVVLVDGFMKGGVHHAQENLKTFWKNVSFGGKISASQSSPWDVFFGKFDAAHNPVLQMMSAWTNMFSPYDMNPLNINPIRDLLAAQIDFEAIQKCKDIKLFISATNVHTGKVRVFQNKEITADVVTASACLPYLFRAVEIEGVPYWDGGFMGNPSLFPFFTHTHCEDILLVQINPIIRRETPKTAQEIADRMNEITFNSSLLGELRAVEFVSRLIEQGRIEHGRYKKIRMHRVEADQALKAYGASSKANTSWEFLLEISEDGKKAMRFWLDKNFKHIGEKATVELKQEIS